jgi:hypothetical protein
MNSFIDLGGVLRARRIASSRRREISLSLYRSSLGRGLVMESDYTVLLNWDNGTRPFKLRGGPIDIPTTRNNFRLLGLAGASWGRLENHIDAILLQINQLYDSNKKLDLHDPYFPSSRKVRLHPGRELQSSHHQTAL